MRKLTGKNMSELKNDPIVKKVVVRIFSIRWRSAWTLSRLTAGMIALRLVVRKWAKEMPNTNTPAMITAYADG
jgi:hypothetical protein